VGTRLLDFTEHCASDAQCSTAEKPSRSAKTGGEHQVRLRSAMGAFVLLWSALELDFTEHCAQA
jgi:hypothetical protein